MHATRQAGRGWESASESWRPPQRHLCKSKGRDAVALNATSSPVELKRFLWPVVLRWAAFRTEGTRRHSFKVFAQLSQRGIGVPCGSPVSAIASPPPMCTRSCFSCPPTPPSPGISSSGRSLFPTTTIPSQPTSPWYTSSPGAGDSKKRGTCSRSSRLRGSSRRRRC